MADLRKQSRHPPQGHCVIGLRLSELSKIDLTSDIGNDMRKACLSKSLESKRRNAGTLALKRIPAAPTSITTLPKSVLDRIHRYAEEGVPQASYEHDCCRLLAVANWQLPVVLLPSTRCKFTEMRSAALTEWTRVACKTSRRRVRGI